jgi:hypothetical protein
MPPRVLNRMPTAAPVGGDPEPLDAHRGAGDVLVLVTQTAQARAGMPPRAAVRLPDDDWRALTQAAVQDAS